MVSRAAAAVPQIPDVSFRKKGVNKDKNASSSTKRRSWGQQSQTHARQKWELIHKEVCLAVKCGQASESVFCSRQTRTSGGGRARRSCCHRVCLLPPSGQNKSGLLVQAAFLPLSFRTQIIIIIRRLDHRFKHKQPVMPS